MEDAEVTEGLDEWEQIQPPWHQTCPTTTASVVNDGSRTTQSRGWDDGMAVVIRDNYLHCSDSSVFPPNDHEGLTVVPPQDTQQPPQQEPTQAFSSSSSSSPPAAAAEKRVGGESGWRLRSHLGVLSSGIVRAAYVVRGYAASRGGFLSFVRVTGVMAVSLLLLKVRRWHRNFRRQTEDRFMLLVREKDQKISELLLQIAQMNEVLSAPRRVPVIRVG